MRIQRYFAIVMFVILGGQSLVSGKSDDSRLNVLMFVVDDLRPILGCYGHSWVQTPSMDRLASLGTVFTSAYCQVPQCGPSRVSVLTGLMPDSTGIQTLNQRFRRRNFDFIKTLPEMFKDHGYVSRGFGKVFHDGRDDPESWSEPLWAGRPTEMTEYVNEELIGRLAFHQRSGVETIVDLPRLESPAFQAPEVPDEALFAGRMTRKVLEVLRDIDGEAFFLSVGFRRPHLPWVAPKRYFDLYPIDSIGLPKFDTPPKNAPIIAFFNSNKYYIKYWREYLGLTDEGTPDSIGAALSYASSELRSYSNVSYPGSISSVQKRELIRAYMACVSYVDAQIGRILNKLEVLKKLDNTIIVLWSDHGWHLGDLGIWGKLTNYDASARVPFIVYDPRGRLEQGVYDRPVELLDLFPTLCALADIEAPTGIDGVSLLQGDKQFARTQYLRDGVMGKSVRSKDFRYVAWYTLADKRLKHEEFYDYRRSKVERENVINRKGQDRMINKHRTYWYEAFGEAGVELGDFRK